MTYTPKFQVVLDHCQAMNQAGAPLSDIQVYFAQQMQALGPYERLNNLYRIRTKRLIKVSQDEEDTGRIQFFRMNQMQEKFYAEHTTRDLILKMRQGGVTTLSCLIALDMCLWNRGVHTAIMAHVQPNVKKYFRISKLAFKWFQRDWGHLYPVTGETDNVNELGIQETGSHLTVCTETKGLTLDFLHISEAAFVEDDRISESLESVPLTSWVIMETTPNCAAGLFYELWDRWLKGEVCTFKGHFFAWWYHYPEPEDRHLLQPTQDFKLTDREVVFQQTHELSLEQLVWRRLKISECGGDEGDFCRKYPEDPMTCFLSGSRSVFPASVLTSLWKHERMPAFVGDLVLDSRTSASTTPRVDPVLSEDRYESAMY